LLRSTRRSVPSLIALFVASSPSSAHASAAESDRKPPAAGNVVLFQSKERVLVMMRVADGDLVPMVFDTGSDGATIDRSIARRLRLKKTGEVKEVDGTTGKERLLPQVALRNVTVGGLKVNMIEAASTDYDRNDAMGIISSEMFTASLLYLDLANNRAVLAPRESTPRPQGVATNMSPASPAYIS
jgi:hypothetical protein